MRSREGMDGMRRDERSLAEAVARSFEPMPPDAKDAVAARLAAVTGPSPSTLRLRWARAAVALATGTSLLGGVSYAAAASAPGDALYPVKRAVLQACEGVGARVRGGRPAGGVPGDGHRALPVTPSAGPTRGADTDRGGGRPASRRDGSATRAKPATVGPEHGLSPGASETRTVPPGKSGARGKRGSSAAESVKRGRVRGGSLSKSVHAETEAPRGQARGHGESAAGSASDR